MQSHIRLKLEGINNTAYESPTLFQQSHAVELRKIVKTSKESPLSNDINQLSCISKVVGQ